MAIHCYSPKPQAEYNSAFAKINKHKDECWNLLYLVVNMDKRYPYSGVDGLIAAVWQTVSCDIITGEHINPFSELRRPVVADLLRSSPHQFYSWALNNPVHELLPITQVKSNWLKSAKRRLPKCAPHPDDVHFMLDEGVTDLRPARALLRKYAQTQKGLL